jgi:hypothetical protein
MMDIREVNLLEFRPPGGDTLKKTARRRPVEHA